MAKRRGELKTDSSGQFFRQIGWKAGAKGQPKFRLGRDRDKAQLAYHKLGMLWDVVVDEHEQQRQLTQDFEDEAEPDERPLWTPEALTIAQAIRKHHHSVRVGQPDHVEGPAAYASYIDHLRQRFGHLINLVPADQEAAEQGKQAHQDYAQHRSRQARHNARIADIPIPSGTVGTTLYQAIDGYAQQVLAHNQKESGKVEADNARRLKNSVGDMDLSDFGFSALERIRNHWASRPEAKLRGGKGSGRPISITTVDNHLSTARRFVRWLDRSDAHRWEVPRHGLDALKVNLKRLRTDEELARRRHGVKVLKINQLALIYKYATDFERLLVLLALNAAMAQAEIRTLRWDEVEDDPATIKRIRRKSGVYGEFALWPETVQALAWWQRIRAAKGDLVMLTNRGRPYTRQRISNTWAALRDRIERETEQSPDWWLPFKHLRKTGAQFVRQVSDGEVAGVFLSHGQPVATDDLADAYTNRPFDKVAQALKQVREELEPVFAAAPGAFEETAIGRGPHRQTAG